MGLWPALALALAKFWNLVSQPHKTFPKKRTECVLQTVVRAVGSASFFSLWSPISLCFPADKVPVVLCELLPADGAPLRSHVARLDLGALGDRRHGNHVHRVACGRAQSPTEDGHFKIRGIHFSCLLGSLSHACLVWELLECLPLGNLLKQLCWVYFNTHIPEYKGLNQERRLK